MTTLPIEHVPRDNKGRRFSVPEVKPHGQSTQEKVDETNRGLIDAANLLQNEGVETAAPAFMRLASAYEGLIQEQPKGAQGTLGLHTREALCLGVVAESKGSSTQEVLDVAKKHVEAAWSIVKKVEAPAEIRNALSTRIALAEATILGVEDPEHGIELLADVMQHAPQPNTLESQVAQALLSDAA